MTAQPTTKQLGVIDGKSFEDWPAWEAQGVPTRDNCDLSNPRQKFLWMFTAMPGLRGAALILPPDYWELMSWRMCVLGADLTGDPLIKWRAPANMLSNPWTAAGDWVDIDEPEQIQTTLAETMKALPAADRAEIRQVVLDEFGLGGADTMPVVPEGQYRVSDLAHRLNCHVTEVVEALASVGLTAQGDSLVDRSIADRIVYHLGLGDD